MAVLDESNLYQFKMEHGQTMANLKELLFKKNKIPVDSQRLKYMNKSSEE